MKAARRAVFAAGIVAVVCVGLGVGVMASTTLSPQLGGSAPPPSAQIQATSGGSCASANFACHGICKPDGWGTAPCYECVNACETHCRTFSCGTNDQCDQWCRHGKTGKISGHGENTALTAVYNNKDGVLVIETSGTPFKEVYGNKVQVYDRKDHGKWVDLKSPVIRDKYVAQVMSTTDKNILKNRTELGIYYKQDWAKDTDGNHIGLGDNALSQVSATSAAISSATMYESVYLSGSGNQVDQLELTMNTNIETMSAGAVSVDTTVKGATGGTTRTGESVSISGNVATVNLPRLQNTQAVLSHEITIEAVSVQTTAGAWNGELSHTLSYDATPVVNSVSYSTDTGVATIIASESIQTAKAAKICVAGVSTGAAVECAESVSVSGNTITADFLNNKTSPSGGAKLVVGAKAIQGSAVGDWNTAEFETNINYWGLGYILPDVQNLAATPDSVGQSIRLNWDAVSSSLVDIVGYYVEYWVVAGEGNTPTRVFTTTNSWTHSDPAVDTKYGYVVAPAAETAHTAHYTSAVYATVESSPANP